jgi:hypothetical protein
MAAGGAGGARRTAACINVSVLNPSDMKWRVGESRGDLPSQNRCCRIGGWTTWLAPAYFVQIYRRDSSDFTPYKAPIASQEIAGPGQPTLPLHPTCSPSPSALTCHHARRQRSPRFCLTPTRHICDVDNAPASHTAAPSSPLPSHVPAVPAAPGMPCRTLKSESPIGAQRIPSQLAPRHPLGRCLLSTLNTPHPHTPDSQTHL